MQRIIQAGVGGMGQVWASTVAQSDRWEAAAYVDINRKALLAAAELHGMPRNRCFKDLKSALGTVEADAVLDVTPQQSRLSVCTVALDRQLDVLCEKPLADTLPNAMTLVDRAAKAGCTLMVAQNYRYQSVVQTVKRFIEKGRLGKVGYVGVQFHKGPHFGGFRETMDHPLLLDMSIHHFDMMRCMLGVDVEAVQGVSTSAPWNWNQGDATASVHLEMAGGVAVNYFASWVARGWETDWNANWRFEGEKGVLLIENSEVFFSAKPGTRRKVPPVAFHKHQQAWLIDHFADSLEKKTEPETSGRNNLNSLATTHAVVRAVRERRRIEVQELIHLP